MQGEDLKPGVEIIVPAGADPLRKNTYRLRVEKLMPSSVPGTVVVIGTVLRMSGAWSAKKNASRFATLRPERVRLANETDG